MQKWEYYSLQVTPNALKNSYKFETYNFNVQPVPKDMGEQFDQGERIDSHSVDGRHTSVFKDGNLSAS